MPVLKIHIHSAFDSALRTSQFAIKFFPMTYLYQRFRLDPRVIFLIFCITYFTSQLIYKLAG